MSAVARYSHIPFPPYRFVLGETPHPTEDPAGYSYGKAPVQLKDFAPADCRTNEEYLYGVDLFNHGYWWEAHEAWEGLWGLVPGGDATSNFLQGLIKLSAAFLKWHMHERKGVQTLFNGAMKLLSQAAAEEPHFMGVDLQKFLELVQKLFAVVLTDPSAWPDLMDNYPYIILEP